MRTIFVVFGESGSYEMWTKWPVRAFQSEQAAQNFVADLTAAYNSIKAKYDAELAEMGKTPRGKVWRSIYPEPDKNIFDPNMVWDSDSLTYTFIPLELALDT